MRRMRLADLTLTTNIMKARVSDETQEVYRFLNDLRDDGDINMFGAAPYIVDFFDVTKGEARRLLAAWFNN